MFRTQGIDHVALAVRDVRSSARWYADVFGLQRLHEEVWGDFPAIVGNGTTAVALFPIEAEQPKPRPGRDTVSMRHLAFRADRANFTAAKAALSGRGIGFTEQHHGICESIYFLIPMATSSKSRPTSCEREGAMRAVGSPRVRRGTDLFNQSVYQLRRPVACRPASPRKELKPKKEI